MDVLFRKLRGVMGAGLTWGFLWGAIGIAIAVIVGILNPHSIDDAESALGLGAAMGVVGFISGAGFAVLLALTENRKAITDLSVGRAALWGTLAAAALPLLTGMANSLILFTCPLGALFAAATVAIARRAELRQPDQGALLRGEPLGM